MKHILFILFPIILCMGCAGKGGPQSASVIPPLGENDYFPDTIPERNDPDSLDLSRHQLFIDTTGDSEYFAAIQNWEVSDLNTQFIHTSLQAMKQGSHIQKIDLRDFPTHFVTLRKFNGEFVLYNRCDGVDPRLELRDTAVVFHGIFESLAVPIMKCSTRTENTLTLEVKTSGPHQGKKRTVLTIDHREDFVYRITIKTPAETTREYMTTRDAAKHFDMLVNHCPAMKRHEFDGFDREEQ
ncbi:MAG: hypothetical protein ACQEQ4_10370 [Fibrobacterota bacterium]